MPREDVEFKTSDQVTLRGWFYKPENKDGKLPCVVMAHGFSALKEMDLDAFAEHFSSNLPVSCLVYDNRGFGASDCAPNAPIHEIIPALQTSDYSDAITYAQSRDDVDPDKIAIWGSSYSGGHVLWVGAVDRRVKTVLCQVPCVDGWENFNRLIRPDFQPGLNAMFQQGKHSKPGVAMRNRLARAEGKDPGRLPVVDEDPQKPSALPTPDSFKFFKAWEEKSNWKNDVTVRTIEAFREYFPSAHIHRIAPTPLLMTVAEGDVLTPADLAIEAYSRAREPKKLHLLPGGHFEAYTGPNFVRNASCQTAFLKEHLLKQG